MITFRHAEPDDFYTVTTVVDDWWGGRHMRDMLPKLFFVHFRETSFVAEEREAPGAPGHLVGFLNGLLSQTNASDAYIHFVGVHPDYRSRGIGRELYGRFFEAARARGRDTVRCVTSPVNKGSIVFHLRLGFQSEPGDREEDGVPVHSDYDGKGESRVLFVKRLY